MRRALLVLAILIELGFALRSYTTIPLRNTDSEHFDAIVVLGTPTEKDGPPTAVQRSRAMEGVREFKAGRADHLVMSGGAAHNRYVEAESMARIAMAAGVPAQDIEIEGRSMNTVENLFYSYEIMQRHGWKSMEIVTSPNHMPRAALILSYYNGAGLQWTTHAAPWPPEQHWWDIASAYAYEIERTAGLLWFGFRRTPLLPGS